MDSPLSPAESHPEVHLSSPESTLASFSPTSSKSDSRFRCDNSFQSQPQKIIGIKRERENGRDAFKSAEAQDFIAVSAATDEEKDEEDKEPECKKSKVSGGTTEDYHGRKSINIQYIKEKSRRHITFSKRKAGIMKKVRMPLYTGERALSHYFPIRPTSFQS
jgi:hypothetical protein